MLSQLYSYQVRRLYNDARSKFRPRRNNVIINWGLSAEPQWQANLAGARIINPAEKVKIAANKLLAFNVLKLAGNVPIPDYTELREEALQWVRDGILVVGRTKLNGHSGAGIILAAREEDVPENCPLYVKYIKKKFEFRVHVVFGNVIDVQQKRKRTDYDGEVDYTVRNHHTGWVYCREGLTPSEDMNNIAVAACATLGLDFGAVDIIYNQHHNQYTVLEVNTAPGLEGTSVSNYANAFHQALQ